MLESSDSNIGIVWPPVDAVSSSPDGTANTDGMRISRHELVFFIAVLGTSEQLFGPISRRRKLKSAPQ